MYETTAHHPCITFSKLSKKWELLSTGERKCEEKQQENTKKKNGIRIKKKENPSSRSSKRLIRLPLKLRKTTANNGEPEIFPEFFRLIHSVNDTIVFRGVFTRWKKRREEHETGSERRSPTLDLFASLSPLTFVNRRNFPRRTVQRGERIARVTTCGVVVRRLPLFADSKIDVQRFAM